MFSKRNRGEKRELLLTQNSEGCPNISPTYSNIDNVLQYIQAITVFRFSACCHSFYSVMKVLLFFTRTSSMLIELADTLHLCHSVEVVIISRESSVHWDINETIDIVNSDSRVNDLLRWKWSILNYWVWKCFGLMSALVFPAPHPTSFLTSSVPTDALANKLFGAPEPSSIARSLPTTVPDSPNYRSARTPRTPRTPHRKDQSMTPRFYPVVKESRPVDAKVKWRPFEGRIWRILVAM